MLNAFGVGLPHVSLRARTIKFFQSTGKAEGSLGEIMVGNMGLPGFFFNAEARSTVVSLLAIPVF
jgi:hypothetical protein